MDGKCAGFRTSNLWLRVPCMETTKRITTTQNQSDLNLFSWPKPRILLVDVKSFPALSVEQGMVPLQNLETVGICLRHLLKSCCSIIEKRAQECLLRQKEWRLHWWLLCVFLRQHRSWSCSWVTLVVPDWVFVPIIGLTLGSCCWWSRCSAECWTHFFDYCTSAHYWLSKWKMRLSYW